MKYVLLIGVYFKKYKNNFKLRISADGHLVDELTIDEEISEKKFEWADLGWNKKIDFMRPGKYDPTDLVWRFPNKIFLYEISDKFLKSHIGLDFNDNNNNYSNGFMTKSNMIKLDELFLFPKCLLQKKRWGSFIKLWRKVYHQRNIKNSKIMFPGATQEFITDVDQGIIGAGKPWMGGNRSLSIHVIKKHGIVFLSPTHTLDQSKKHTYSVNVRFPAYLYHYRLINI